MTDREYGDAGSPSAGADEPEYEYLIIGAGVTGLYQLYRMLQAGVRVIAVDANGDVGGTWFRNRYPGCRFDSESYSYGYSFSQDLLQEWNWSELFAARAETQSYLSHVADKFGLRPHIRFDARVTSATFDDLLRIWTVGFADGRSLRSRFVLTAVGLLSTPTRPRYEGVDSFRGASFHTFFWPAEGIELAGKRVAVIGTGATGVQVISAIAGEVETLTVYQRRPNWCAPLRNRPIERQEMEQIKQTYDSIFERCHNSASGFLHTLDPRKTFEVDEDERRQFWEKLYREPGFGIWLGNFKDTMVSAEANAELSRFIADKIRGRVHDPEVAEKLVPKDHGFGTRRVPMETGYYEAYNRPNVTLVDLQETPIERITERGILSGGTEREFDIIVYATGFDAVTGAFDQIDIVGAGGVRLRDKWAEGPVTYLGLQVSGFPNFFMLLGPQSGSAASNFPRGSEDIVDWMTDFAQYMRRRDVVRVECSCDSEQEWLEHLREMSKLALVGQSPSWLTGRNTNLDRDSRPRLMVYTGGAHRYRRRLAEQSQNGYPGFHLERAREASPLP